MRRLNKPILKWFLYLPLFNNSAEFFACILSNSLRWTKQWENFIGELYFVFSSHFFLVVRSQSMARLRTLKLFLWINTLWCASTPATTTENINAIKRQCERISSHEHDLYNKHWNDCHGEELNCELRNCAKPRHETNSFFFSLCKLVRSWVLSAKLPIKAGVDTIIFCFIILLHTLYIACNHNLQSEYL